MYETKMQVTSTYVGPERRLTVPWLFRIFQDAAIMDVESIGYDSSKTMAKGLLWVFSRVYVRFNAMPKYLSNVRFETHPGGKMAFLFKRYGTLYDEQGNVAAQISSIWALIHEDTRKLEPRPELGDINECNGEEIPLPGKVVAAPVKKVLSRRVEYSDIDLNGHLNNVRYIEILMNLHAPEFYQKNQFKELLIQYESEIRAGEVIDVYVDENMEYVRGVVDDRIAFETNIKYAPIE